MTTKPITVTFEYDQPIRLVLDVPKLRKTLEEVRDQLLRHEINGGGKKLTMDTVCQDFPCGTAACIGGWASLILLGFEGSTQDEQNTVNDLFDNLARLDRNTAKKRYMNYSPLEQLFYDYGATYSYNTPNIAATAIQRYLDGKKPWPGGKMPDVLKYKRSASKGPQTRNGVASKKQGKRK